VTEGRDSHAYRRIEWVPGFLEDLQRLCGDRLAADQVLFGVRWVLMRYPEEGRRLKGSIWSYVTRVAGRDIRLLIYYRFDDETVTLLRVTPQPM
jgi:mRNA-degrading endonuclease RelE of RelBE toxin-antitoxin system